MLSPPHSVRWRVIGRRRSKAQEREAKSGVEFSVSAFRHRWFLSDTSANRLTFSPEVLTRENPSHDRKFSESRGLINWREGWRDERQRVWDEFLTADSQFFSCSFFMTGWQELGAKDLQGSARLSKCLLNNAGVPKGTKGEHTHTHTYLR